MTYPAPLFAVYHKADRNQGKELFTFFRDVKWLAAICFLEASCMFMLGFP